MAGSPLSKDEIQKHIDVIFSAAIEIYDIIPEGATFEVSILTQPDVILPNQKPEVKTLLITRPHKYVRVRGGT